MDRSIGVCRRLRRELIHPCLFPRPFLVPLLSQEAIKLFQLLRRLPRSLPHRYRPPLEPSSLLFPHRLSTRQRSLPHRPSSILPTLHRQTSQRTSRSDWEGRLLPLKPISHPRRVPLQPKSSVRPCRSFASMENGLPLLLLPLGRSNPQMGRW